MKMSELHRSSDALRPMVSDCLRRRGGGTSRSRHRDRSYTRSGASRLFRNILRPDSAYTNEGNSMNGVSEGIRFHRYRLVVISTWPESETKRAALASARAALDREVAFAQSRRVSAAV